MTAGDSRITSAGKKKLRRGCLWTLIVFGVGCYAGLAATRWAITGPEWVRRYAHITLPTPTPAVVPAQAPPVTNPNPLPQNSGNNTVAPNTSAAPGSAPGSASAGTSQPGVAQNVNPDGPAGNGAQTHPLNAPSKPQTPPEGGWIVGTWEVTDELHPTGSQSSSVISDYIFDEGGTGEYDTNGKKLYDIHWEDAGDYLLLTFVTDADGEQNLKVKMKYSINADHSLLTLLPEGKQDPRGVMYGAGSRVYHRKP